MTPILKVENLSKSFPIKGGIFKRTINTVKAVRDINFEVYPGQTLGIVGESGCGKTTLGRTLIRLYDPTEGKISFLGRDFSSLNQKELKKARQDIQMIFQDPYSSLNPRMSVGSILEEPLSLHSIGTPKSRRETVEELLELVGLPNDALQKFPHEFSGGQRQRIAIARALALKPKMIIADEPVSALDVSIQSQIINLLVELQNKLNLTLIFISHDLSVVKYISDKVAVMYLGKIVEFGSQEEIFNSPQHPYTQALLRAIPVPNPHDKMNTTPLKGDVPSPANPPSGCTFHTRCPIANDSCKLESPSLEGGEHHKVACFNRKHDLQS